MSSSRIAAFVMVMVVSATACAGRGIAQTGLAEPRGLTRSIDAPQGAFSAADSIHVSAAEQLYLLGIPPGLRREAWDHAIARYSPAARRLDIKLVVSIADRSLSALIGRDTVFYAPVGVATGLSFSYAGQSWRFQTPKGGRQVLGKVADPVWTPPDWHYAEVARENGLRLARIPAGGVKLKDGSRLSVQNRVVGITFRGERKFEPLPIDEHVVFDDRLFIPPLGTHNRRISGELGNFALDLGGGYLIHGTPDPTSIGQRSTHGCIRVRDEDLAWLFANVPVGSAVRIH